MTSKNVFDAKMHLMPKCIWCVHFVTQNVTNAFDAKMHLMPKCIWCQNAFDAKMHFGNATQRNATLCKNAFDAKMHLMRTFCYTKCYKCIWCQNAFWLCKNAFLHHIFQRKMFSNAYILRSKMFSITFYEGKCSASHFPKENVQHHILRSQMFSITFSKGKCSAKQNVTNAFLHSITFDFVKCSASHFPKENVQQRTKYIFA